MTTKRNRERGGRRARVAETATEQGGVVSLQQLGDAGISARSASRAAATGGLHRIHRGVYAVGHRSIVRSAELRAALLACGEGSVISHGTAAAFLGLWDRWPSLIDVTVPNQTGRKIDGIRCRRCRYPNPEECHVQEGVNCTTPARTFVDLAGSVGTATLRRTVARAAVLKLLDIDAVNLALHNGRGRRGLRSLGLVIAPWQRPDGPMPDVRSDFESLALPRLLEVGLPRPSCNVWLAFEGERFLVDFLWEGPQVIVETDGRQTHETPIAFQSDRRRDQFLTAAGYRVLRVTWRQLHSELDRVITRVSHTLRSR